MNGAQSAPVGVLLAAGRGRRMGCTKQLLRLPTDEGQKSLVAVAFDAIAGVCQEMVVVLGHDADAVGAVLGDRRYRSVASDPESPMFASVCVGLLEVQRSALDAAVLLQPADHPAVEHETLDTLLRSATIHPGRAVIPEHEGQGGHPVLIPSALIGELLRYDGSGGLRAFWARNSEKCIRVPVDDRFVTLNLNSAADFERLGSWQ